MKSAVLDGVPDLPGLVAVLVYDTKPVYFLSVCCNSIKWVHKKCQVYDPETKMLRDTQFLRLDINAFYNYNMHFVDLSDQIWNVQRFDHFMCRYKWWWSILFWGHGLVLFNAYIIYKKYVKRAR